MILSFRTCSSFIHLKSVFPLRFLPFLLPFTPFPRFFFLFSVRPPLFRWFPLFPRRDAFSFLPTLADALAFRTRSAREGVVVRIITCTHPGCRLRPRRCVKPGNRFGTRNCGECRAGRLRGTVPRRTCVSQSSHHWQGTAVIMPVNFYNVALTEN